MGIWANEADVAQADQAEIDKVDADILVAPGQGFGVISGLAVAAQGTPDMTVAVSAGTILAGAAGGYVSVAAVASLAIGAADATNARYDLVVVSSAGVVSVVAGTPATNPVYPAIPAGSIALAHVYVPATQTTIPNTLIRDKKVPVAAHMPAAQMSGAALIQARSLYK